MVRILKILNKIYKFQIHNKFIDNYIVAMFSNFEINLSQNIPDHNITIQENYDILINGVYIKINTIDDCIDKINYIIKKQLIEENEDYLIIHGGIVKISNKYFVVIGKTKSGKSSFCALINELYGKSYCDDIILINKTNNSFSNFEKAFSIRRGTIESYSFIKYDYIIKTETEYRYIINNSNGSISIRPSAIILLNYNNLNNNSLVKLNKYQSMKILIGNSLSSKFPEECYSNFFNIINEYDFYHLNYTDISKAMSLLIK